MVWAKGPSGKDCQVWTNDEGSKLYVYDNSVWNEYTPSPSNDGKVFWPTWKAVDADDEVWFYDTNKATELFTWESGDEVSYVFKDYDGTVLKQGKVEEGTKPTAPADPERTGYTFTWWNPAVAKITKRTVYTAQYERNMCAITNTINSWSEFATVAPTSMEVPQWVELVPLIDETTQEIIGYQYKDGETLIGQTEFTKSAPWIDHLIININSTQEEVHIYIDPETGKIYIIGDCDFKWAVLWICNATVTVNDETMWSVVSGLEDWVLYGSSISIESNVITFSLDETSVDATATPESGFVFKEWTLSNWDPIPATVTGNLSIVAVFESESEPETPTETPTETETEAPL